MWDLPYDPAIPLLGMYLEKLMLQKDTCTPMFISELHTTAENMEATEMSIHRLMDTDVVCGIAG